MDQIIPSASSIIFAKVMHHRLIPEKNKFFYNMFYFVINAENILCKSGNYLLGINKFGLFSLNAKDHGDKTGNLLLEQWLKKLLDIIQIPELGIKNITLITLPRVMGYVFNPVSFWMCIDNQKKLRAVICEVNNTFGERHVYICAHSDRREILENDIMVAYKTFHVSPFIKREGHYEFKFAMNDKNFSAIINYYTQDNQKMLLTSVVGNMQPANNKVNLRVFFSFPLITLKTIFLIHLQAVIIILKGIKYIPKPLQNTKTIIQSSEIT